MNFNLTLGKKDKDKKDKKKPDKRAKGLPEGEIATPVVTQAVPAKPIPKNSKLSKPFLAIDVGSRQVKVVEGQYKNGRIYLKKLCHYDLPEKALKDGHIEMRHNVSGSIASALKESRSKLKTAICTVESSEIIRREMVVPKIKEKEMREMLKYEVSHHLPVDISSYAVQYKKLGEVITDQGTQVRMLVCAMPKEIAQEYLSVLSNAHVKPVAMDTNTNSLEKLLRVESLNNPEMQGKTVVLIDMGHSMFNMSFFCNGEYVFSRIAEVGGHMIDDVILNNFEISAEEAEKLKKHNLTKISMMDLHKAYGTAREYGAETEAEEELILRETMNVVRQWVRAMDGVIKYYCSRDVNNRVDEIYLYGGGSHIKDIEQYLEGQLGVKVKKLEQLRCLEWGRGQQTDDISEYLNAIGALIRV